MASTVGEKSEDKSKSEPNHSALVIMLPMKRSIEYKLPEVSRFVNDRILYNFGQFYQSRQMLAGSDILLRFRATGLLEHRV